MLSGWFMSGLGEALMLPDRLAQDGFAGCEAKHQQTAFAKKKQHDDVFFVKTPPQASADPGSRLCFLID